MVLNKTTGGKPSLKRIKKQGQIEKKTVEVSNNVKSEKLSFTKIWGSMLIELRAGKFRALYGEASLAESGELVDNCLNVVVPKYSVDVLNDEQNKAILEKTIFTLFGQHLKLNVMAKPDEKDENIDKLKKFFGKKLVIDNKAP